MYFSDTPGRVIINPLLLFLLLQTCLLQGTSIVCLSAKTKSFVEPIALHILNLLICLIKNLEMIWKAMRQSRDDWWMCTGAYLMRASCTPGQMYFPKYVNTHAPIEWVGLHKEKYVWWHSFPLLRFCEVQSESSSHVTSARRSSDVNSHAYVYH